MDTHLQNFKKPDREFLKDKECLICLESVDVEMIIIVALPCNCANSAYHIACIMQLLQSGVNKNFCPHCKTVYLVPLMLPSVPLAQDADHRAFVLKSYTHIIMFHLLSNTFLNFFNIFLCNTHSEFKTSEELQALMPIFFLKLFCNYVHLMLAKSDVEKIKTMLFSSYSYQLIVFGFMIYTFTQIENDANSGFLVIVNVIFSGLDVLFRFIIERRIENRVNVVR